MKKTNKPVSADTIARRADKGIPVGHFFKGRGRMMEPIELEEANLMTQSARQPSSAKRQQSAR